MRRANSYRMGEIKRNFLFCVFREGEPVWLFLAKPKCNQSDEVGMTTTTCAFYLCVSCKEVLVLILHFSVKKKGVGHESKKTNVHMKESKTVKLSSWV